MSLAFGYAHGQFSSFYLLSTFGGVHTRLITWRVGAWEPGNETITHCSHWWWSHEKKYQALHACTTSMFALWRL